MNKRMGLLVVGLVCVLGAGAYAEDGAMPQGMDPAQMEQMKAMMTPGEGHEVLKAFEGEWTYTAKFWMMANDVPQEMMGSSVNELVYGGRFLKQTTTGTWMGAPWEGMGYVGYDNMRKQYQSVWIDGMSTGMMWSEGEYDAAAKKLTLGGTASCPMSGDTHQKMRSEWQVIDADHSVYSGYSNGPDGKEFKGMEIHYTRK